MAANEQEQDRSEQASPFKLREARKRGQVAKSVELTGWMVVLATAAFIYIFGANLLREQLRLAGALLSQSGHVGLTVQSAKHLFGATALHLLAAFWFLIAVIVGVGLLANFMQIGPVFSWTPLKPDFNRLNPAAGFKKLFNKRLLFELFKTLLKIAVVTAVLALFIRSRSAQLLGLLHIGIGAQPQQLLQETLRLAFWLLGAWAFLAVFDFGFMKWEFARNMRMSRREQREEYKRREGDPKIKARIRELQREAIKRGASLRRVSEADVLITNPTHLSVAILYEKAQMVAPTVIAKGAGELALRMREKARRSGVPVVEDKALARMLFRRVRIDDMIAPEAYAPVARILTQIYRSRGR